ncbi:hypothetical protein V1512DRAFT_259253 [Lipomyces arxii]|uniref:uncharacterized protein n=1 Tax=Lipomyces arxii TaxID=56418 RepID=UPI0034CE3F75
MPIIRRYVQLTPSDAILARIFLDPSDVSFFDKSVLGTVFRDIKPTVYRRLRDQKTEKGVSVASVVGDRDGREADRQQQQQQQQQTTLSGGGIVRENATANRTGDLIARHDLGWECLLFLVKDRGKSSALVVKDLKLLPRRTARSQVIDLENDGQELPDDDAVPLGNDGDSEDDDDVKPDISTGYIGFDIYGKALYLVLRRVRSKGGGDDVEQDENVVQESTVVDWISASQAMTPNDGVDFEAR